MKKNNNIKCSGIILLSKITKRVCFQQRKPNKYNKIEWGFFGGKSELDELPIDCALRELKEEFGYIPEYIKIYPFSYYFNDKNNFKYETFIMLIENECIPILNDESIGYCWSNINYPPKPLTSGSYNLFINEEMRNKIKSIVEL